jgi:hypothetical protein
MLMVSSLAWRVATRLVDVKFLLPVDDLNTCSLVSVIPGNQVQHHAHLSRVRQATETPWRIHDAARQDPRRRLGWAGRPARGNLSA